MAPKRTLDLAVADRENDSNYGGNRDDSEPPIKRRMLSIPQTPLANKSSPLSRTPFTGTPYPPRPSDSPSNPFGRKRRQALTHSLPPPTSFSKHLPLRFQFVRPGLSPRLGGIYRIVQVPLNYTFVQLRCLIAFLFGAGCSDRKEDRHLFEIQKKVTLYSQTYKPGHIKSGFTTVKLSTARDPCRYRPEIDEDALFADDDPQTRPTAGSEVTAEEADEGDGWTWQPEEEYTLGHAWSKGGDLARAITYHHDTTTAIHITMNTGPLPRRSGISNTPYIFQARGRVRLLPPSPPLLPRPVFSLPSHKFPVPANAKKIPRARASATVSALSSSKVINTEEDSDDSDDEYGEYGDASSCGVFQENSDVQEDVDGEADHEVNDNEEEDIEEEEEDLHATIPPSKYNVHNAFAIYLRMLHQHNQRWKFTQSDTSESDDDNAILRSTPGLVHCPSSSPVSSSPVASSPASVISMFSHEPYQASVLSSLSKAAPTPAPLHAPWQRLRLERVQKRMDKLKKQEWMCTKDESESEEVDQLAEKGRTHEDEKDKTEEVWVKPVLKPGEVWDPFGDEIEI